MAEQNGADKRKHPRMKANFIVSYRIKEMPGDYDLSQSKDVGAGGMLFTTNKIFKPGDFLSMNIRFPIIPQKITVTGQVVGSREVVRDLIYETRIKFVDLDEDFFRKLGEFIKEHIK